MIIQQKWQQKFGSMITFHSYFWNFNESQTKNKCTEKRMELSSPGQLCRGFGPWGTDLSYIAKDGLTLPFSSCWEGDIVLEKYLTDGADFISIDLCSALLYVVSLPLDKLNTCPRTRNISNEEMVSKIKLWIFIAIWEKESLGFVVVLVRKSWWEI